jgi:hypothetical protein
MFSHLVDGQALAEVHVLSCTAKLWLKNMVPAHKLVQLRVAFLMTARCILPVHGWSPGRGPRAVMSCDVTGEQGPSGGTRKISRRTNKSETRHPSPRYAYIVADNPDILIPTKKRLIKVRKLKPWQRIFGETLADSFSKNGQNILWRYKISTIMLHGMGWSAIPIWRL